MSDNIWNDTWARYEGRCCICKITEAEGSNLGVHTIFQERPLNALTVHPLEFVLFCIPCRAEIERCFAKKLVQLGIMREYWRQRGKVVDAIERSRKEASRKKN